MSANLTVERHVHRVRRLDGDSSGAESPYPRQARSFMSPLAASRIRRLVWLVWRGTQRGKQLLYCMTKLLGVYRFDDHEVEQAVPQADVRQAHTYLSPENGGIDD